MTGKLTARRVAGFKAPGKLGDGGGLWLRATRGGGRWWFLRYRFRGRNRELGLGSPDEVGLKEARQDAVWARRQIHEGIDPIEQRRNERGARQVQRPDLRRVCRAVYQRQPSGVAQRQALCAVAQHAENLRLPRV